MACLKCGRETGDDGVFCQECLDSMAQSPVKPGTRVVIPKRPEPEPQILPVKTQSPEEIIEKLRKRIRVLALLVFLLFVSLSVSLGFIVHHHKTAVHGEIFGIGQNYSTEAAEGGDHGR